MDIVVSRTVPDQITVAGVARPLAHYTDTTVGLEYEFGGVRVDTEQQTLCKSRALVGPQENRLSLLNVTRDMGTDDYTLELITGAVEVGSLPGPTFTYMGAFFAALHAAWKAAAGPTPVATAAGVTRRLNDAGFETVCPGAQQQQEARTFTGSTDQFSSPQVNIGVVLSDFGITSGQTYELMKRVYSSGVYEHAVGAVRAFIAGQPAIENWEKDSILRGILVTYAIMSHAIGTFLAGTLASVNLAPDGPDNVGCRDLATRVRELDSKSVEYKNGWGGLIKARPSHLWRFMPSALVSSLRTAFLANPKTFATQFATSMIPHSTDAHVRAFMGLAFGTIPEEPAREWCNWGPAPKPIDVFRIGDYPAMVIELRTQEDALQVRDGAFCSPELAELYLQSLTLASNPEGAKTAHATLVKKRAEIPKNALSADMLAAHRAIAARRAPSVDDDDDDDDDSDF
jgi:hypothetical protein